MRYIDLDKVQAANEFRRPAPGGYICGITAVKDVPEKEYLRIEFDIAEGEFKRYYTELNKARGFWGGVFVRSYSDAALPFFKSFITAVEKSNNGYKFDYEEQKLKGKYIGLVLGEEEYMSRTGEIKTRLYVHSTRSVQAIKNGEFKAVPKKLFVPDAGQTSENIQDDLPF